MSQYPHLLVPTSLALTFTQFTQANTSSSGVLTASELATWLKLRNARFARRVAKVFADADGNITFVQFLINIWIMCAASKQGLKLFAHQLYDSTKCGRLCM